MPTYIILGKFTHEGATKIKDSPKRLEAARQVIKSHGGELKKFYYTLGSYDFVGIAEAPNEEAVMKTMMSIGAKGAVSTETLVAFPSDKAEEMIKELP